MVEFGNSVSQDWLELQQTSRYSTIEVEPHLEAHSVCTSSLGPDSVESLISPSVNKQAVRGGATFNSSKPLCSCIDVPQGSCSGAISYPSPVLSPETQTGVTMAGGLSDTLPLAVSSNTMSTKWLLHSDGSYKPIRVKWPGHLTVSSMIPSSNEKSGGTAQTWGILATLIKRQRPCFLNHVHLHLFCCHHQQHRDTSCPSISL
jgi:hypothetical protein